MNGMDSLNELALDLMWSWNHKADKIWKELDPELWDLTHNPWVVLQTVSREKLKQRLDDPNFQKLIDELLKAKRERKESSNWFQSKYPKAPLKCVAYFCMEFMLSEALPIYSGGLGNVAGDQLKSASDLGVPVIGISLLYQQGYFRQMIDKNGVQEALFPYNDPGQLPIAPLRRPNGEWLRLEIALPGWKLWLRTWEVKVGRCKLYLLDSNDAANFPAHRGITSELYGGNAELRLKQELVLGLGGWRLLHELGIHPEVCHLNEGHAAFAILERAKDFVKENGVSFEEALMATRAGNVFTTHTAVSAGFDYFSPFLIKQYLTKYAQDLGISIDQLLALGRQNPQNTEEYFNMAILAIRGSGVVNGVSKLHGRVSRHLFCSLFPRWPMEEVPIGSVTNGIHIPSWDSAQADNLWTEVCGKERWLGETETLTGKIRGVSDDKLWQMRNESRKALVEFAHERIEQQLAARGESKEAIEQSKLMDPNILTIGFARRFATYKRPNLLLHDPERLLRILTNVERPAQLILAGKAHPHDSAGQLLIQRWIQFIHQYQEARSHVVFLSDYDMLLTEQLVQGVDVWINTPERPWEASGTSGMKILVNGGLNLSELDGWWAEAYRPDVGWALGDGKEHGDDPTWNAAEAEALYELLEKEVIPTFYKRDAKGVPKEWIARIRESMASLTPQFSANRVVREYTEKYYLTAAKNYQMRAANQAAVAKEILHFKRSLEQNWPKLRFGEMKIETKAENHRVELQAFLDGLDPQLIKIELYANGSPPFKQEMKSIRKLEAPHAFVYGATVPGHFPIQEITARMVPHFPDVAVPLELGHILWQK